jgi:glycosyltransferase involved in cell wall biosynthesis
MRILIWSPSFSMGGGSRLLPNLATAIARQEDIEWVRIVVSPKTELKKCINTTRYPNIEIIYTEEDIRTSSTHPYISDCHVVYVFWPHGHAFVPMNRPTIITFHDAIIFDYVPQFMSGTNLKSHWQQAKGWFKHCTQIIVSSNYVKSRIIAHFGKVGETARVIPHAVSPAKYFASSALSPLLAAKLPKKYFIYPANTSPHKNHFNLLLAYAQFSARKQYPLVLTGHLTDKLRQEPPNWPDHYSLPTLVSIIKRQELKIDGDVFPLGLVTDQDIVHLIQNASGLIMPSLAEGGGSYPVEEALSMGVPVLCSDIPVMREHLKRRSAKIAWFRPDSPDSIVRAMEDFIEHYDVYIKSARSGMNDPSQSWDDIAKQYISEFRKAYLAFYASK